MPERVALYPGSFDPLTNGHLDVLFRARRLADRVIVAILENDEKKPLFSVEERLEMIREIVGGDSAVSVRSFSGLLVDFAAETGATLLVRGLRAISDFEVEMGSAIAAVMTGGRTSAQAVDQMLAALRRLAGTASPV